MPSPKSSRRFGFEPHWLLLIVSLLVLGVVMVLSRLDAREQLKHRERDRLLAQARVLQFIVGNNIVTANTILKEQAQDWAVNDRRSTSRKLRVLDGALAGMRSLMVLDANGISIASSREELIGRNFSERPYFLYFKDRPPGDQLFISPPFRSVLGSVVMILSRPVYDGSGAFRGVVTATLDPDFFAPLLKAIRTTPDLRAAIVHGEGLLFLVEPGRSSAALMNLNEPWTVFRRHLDSGNAFDVIKGKLKVTGEYGMWVAYTARPADVKTNSSIVVMVGRSLDGVLAVWRRNTFVLGLLYVGIAAASCCGLLIYLKRKRQFDRQIAESARRLEAEARFVQTVTDGVPGLIGYWNDELRCEFANKAYREWFGKTPGEMIGISIREALGEKLFNFSEAYIHAALWGEPQSFERATARADGGVAQTLVRYIPDDQDGKVRGFFVLASDVTEIKRTQEKLEALVKDLNTQATTDALTGLSNRRHFWEQAKLEIARSMRYNLSLYLIMLDIDKFKSINDGFGHAGGDEVLRHLSATLTVALRETDVIGRLGGEEFGILLIQTAEADAKRIAERLRQVVAASEVFVEGAAIHYTISLGLAAARRNETSVDALVKRADMALYQAKETGRNRVCYAEDMEP